MWTHAMARTNCRCPWDFHHPSPLCYAQVPLTGGVIRDIRVPTAALPIGTRWGGLEQPHGSSHHSNSQGHKAKETERSYAWFQHSFCSWEYTESREQCQTWVASQRRKSHTTLRLESAAEITGPSVSSARTPLSGEYMTYIIYVRDSRKWSSKSFVGVFSHGKHGYRLGSFY